MFKKCLLWLRRYAPLLNTFVLIVAVAALVVAVRTLFTANQSLRVAIDQREQARVLGAWNIIAISPQARGNIGQKQALEFLLERGENLRSINLRQAYLEEVELPGANLWNARLEGAILERAKLMGATLKIARLRAADMRGADLSGASLQCAQLSPGPAEDGSGLFFKKGADLKGATLVGATFDGADLRGVDLADADISGASFGAYDCDVGDRRETRVKPEQLVAACADPARPPKFPEDPVFADLDLRECPTG